MLSIVDLRKAGQALVVLSDKNHRKDIPLKANVFAAFSLSRKRYENDCRLSNRVIMKSVRDQVNREKAGPDLAPADLTPFTIGLIDAITPVLRSHLMSPQGFSISKTIH